MENDQRSGSLEQFLIANEQRLAEIPNDQVPNVEGLVRQGLLIVSGLAVTAYALVEEFVRNNNRSQ